MNKERKLKPFWKKQALNITKRTETKDVKDKRVTWVELDVYDIKKGNKA